MGGHHHMVVAVFPPVRQDDLYGIGGTPQPAYGGVRPEFTLETFHERFHIGVAPALNNVPLGLIADRQKTVVVEKSGEGGHRKFGDFCIRRRPDGRGHGDDVLLPEARAETEAIQKTAQRDGRQPPGSQFPAGGAIEAQDFQ